MKRSDHMYLSRDDKDNNLDEIEIRKDISFEMSEEEKNLELASE